MHAHLDTFTADWMIWIIRCIEWCELFKPLSCKLIYSTNSIRAERSKLINGFNDNANRCYSNTPSPGNLRRIHSVLSYSILSIRNGWSEIFNAPNNIANHYYYSNAFPPWHLQQVYDDIPHMRLHSMSILETWISIRMIWIIWYIEWLLNTLNSDTTWRKIYIELITLHSTLPTGISTTSWGFARMARR